MKLREHHTLEIDLRAAISEQRLILRYQPQVDLLTGKVLGAEALVRWNRPDHGLVPPDRFIGWPKTPALLCRLACGCFAQPVSARPPGQSISGSL